MNNKRSMVLQFCLHHITWRKSQLRHRIIVLQHGHIIADGAPKKLAVTHDWYALNLK